MSKFVAVRWDCPPSPGFPIKVFGDIGVTFWKIMLLDTVLY